MKKLAKILALSLTSLALTSCYTWWEKQIDLDSKYERADLAEFFYKAPVVTSLDAPEQVIASPGYYNGSVKIRWSEVENATSYRIERAEMPKNSTELPEEGDFAVITEYVYDTTYNDIILSNPTATSDAYTKQYYYRISAENISRGLESSEYTDISNPATCAVGWLFTPPANVDASKGESSTEIKITWDKVPGATQYKIYRGEAADYLTEYDTIRGSQNYYINTIDEIYKGKELFYQVSAVHNIGSTSAKSSTVLGYTLANAQLLPPSDLAVTNGLGEETTSIKLTWTPVSQDADPNVKTTYTVYRTSNVDSSYRTIAKNLPSTTNSITDENNLKPGVIYYYYIQTVKTKDDTNEKSAFTKKGPFGFLLSAPSIVEAGDVINSEGNISDQYINVCWNDALGASGAEEGYDFGLTFKYNIYYSDTMDGEFVKITDSPLEGLTKNADGLYEYKVPKKGFYKVSTVNSNGTESALSATIAPLPDAPKNVIASKTEGGSLVTDYIFESTGEHWNNNNVYPVRITWQAPDSNPQPVGYNIYRSTKPDSSFRKLNDELITGFEYIDLNETARAGTYYYYKVVSVNILGQGKRSNDPTNDTENKCRGYGAITQDQWFREYNPTVMRSQSKLSLMHKPNDMDKLGSETITGDIKGSLSYKAEVKGFGAEITMRYENYCDFWAGGDEANGPYYLITGNTDTTSNMSANGNMHGIVQVTGMYPGKADYGKLEIKGGAAGGGGYLVETKDLNGNVILPEKLVNWLVGEENRK